MSYFLPFVKKKKLAVVLIGSELNLQIKFGRNDILTVLSLNHAVQERALSIYLVLL